MYYIKHMFNFTSLLSPWRKTPFHPYSNYRLKKQGIADGKRSEPAKDSEHPPRFLAALKSQGEMDMKTISGYWEKNDKTDKAAIVNSMNNCVQLKEKECNKRVTHSRLLGRYSINNNGEIPPERLSSKPLSFLLIGGLIIGESVFNQQIFEAIAPNQVCAFIMAVVFGVLLYKGAYWLGVSLKHREPLQAAGFSLLCILALGSGLFFRVDRISQMDKAARTEQRLESESYSTQTGKLPESEKDDHALMSAVAYLGINILMIGLAALMAYKGTLPKDLEEIYKVESALKNTTQKFNAAKSELEKQKAKRESVYADQRNGAASLGHSAEQMKDIYSGANFDQRNNGDRPNILICRFDLPLPAKLEDDEVKFPEFEIFEEKLKELEDHMAKTLEDIKEELRVYQSNKKEAAKEKTKLELIKTNQKYAN